MMAEKESGELQIPTVSRQEPSSLFSSLPEVSGLTIAVVASGCAVLIVCLMLVLLFFCCRNRRGDKGNNKGGSSDSSDRFSHRDVSSVEVKVMGYMQYNDGCGQQQQQQQQQLQQRRQQQYAMVSPHPSLTSTDETSVDQSSGKVFATLVSANNPVTAAPQNELGSESDHSGSLLRPSPRQHQAVATQRRIIYEVVV